MRCGKGDGRTLGALARAGAEPGLALDLPPLRQAILDRFDRVDGRAHVEAEDGVPSRVVAERVVVDHVSVRRERLCRRRRRVSCCRRRRKRTVHKPVVSVKRSDGAVLALCERSERHRGAETTHWY